MEQRESDGDGHLGSEPWDRSYVLCRDRFVRYASRLLSGDREAAEDVVGDVHLRMRIRAVPHHADAIVLAKLLYRAVRNAAFDERRRRARVVSLTEALPLIDSGMTTQEAVLLAELQRAVSGVIDELSPSLRRIGSLYFQSGMSSAEISEAAGVAEKTVHNVVATVRRALRSRLQHLAPSSS